MRDRRAVIANDLVHAPERPLPSKGEQLTNIYNETPTSTAAEQ
jgi:hypothetical protein